MSQNKTSESTETPAEEKGLAGIVSHELLGLLESTAYNLWMSAIQSQSPNGQRLYLKMKEPQVGDTVMEITSYRRYGAVERMGYGKLIEVQEGDLITKKWTIETPFGRIVDWTNAMIIAIPGQEFDWYPAICQPNETSSATGGAQPTSKS